MTTGRDESFEAKARAYWTKDREAKVTGGKKLLLRPSEAPSLLRALGILNGDASMSANKTRKFLQINHMLSLVTPQLDDLAERHKVVRVLDAACGNSFLTLLLTWYLRDRKAKPCEVLGIDRNAKVIQQSRERAAALGYGDVLRFHEDDLDPAAWGRGYAATFGASSGEGEVPRPHLVVALHACDTATDAALALAVGVKADVIAVAPCCHAELAGKWKQIAAGDHPLAPVFRTPNLRRETASHLTDAMRMLLVRSRGYEVTATEFVASEHTPKNRLLLAERRGSFLKEAGVQYDAMKGALAGQGIALEGLLP